MSVEQSEASGKLVAAVQREKYITFEDLSKPARSFWQKSGYDRKVKDIFDHPAVISFRRRTLGPYEAFLLRAMIVKKIVNSGDDNNSPLKNELLSFVESRVALRRRDCLADLYRNHLSPEMAEKRFEALIERLEGILSTLSE